LLYTSVLLVTSVPYLRFLAVMEFFVLVRVVRGRINTNMVLVVDFPVVKTTYIGYNYAY